MRFQNEGIQTFRALVKASSDPRRVLAQGTQLSLSTVLCAWQAFFYYLDGKTGRQKDIKGALNLLQVLSFFSSSSRSFSLPLPKAFLSQVNLKRTSSFYLFTLHSLFVKNADFRCCCYSCRRRGRHSQWLWWLESWIWWTLGWWSWWPWPLGRRRLGRRLWRLEWRLERRLGSSQRLHHSGCLQRLREWQHHPVLQQCQLQVQLGP